MNNFSIRLKDFSKENVFKLFILTLTRILLSAIGFYLIGTMINMHISMLKWNMFSQMLLSVFFFFSTIFFVLVAIEHDEKI